MLFNKRESKIFEYLIKYTLIIYFFLALLNILDFPNNLEAYAWELMLFSFVVGGFILSIRPEYVSKEQIKILPRISFLMIFSSMLLFIGYSFFLCNGSGILKGTIMPVLSVIIIFIGMICISLGLSELTIELGKNIFSRK